MTNSLPNKLFEGQTGYPTPNAPPENTGCRVFIIPSDEEWFALFMAAALTLTYEWAWFKNGDLTQAEAAAAWSDIIDDAYARSLLGTCLLEVPAPYWDQSSADDADDEMSPETQIWYGEIVALPAFRAEDAELTFLDNIGIWAIAGFIAYAGQPGAAIAFVPLAKKFVLSFKQHSLGGIVSILFDFLHLADVDTYGVEDGVVDFIVSMPDDEMSHTLYVEMSEEVNPAVAGEPNIQVIRKRLDVQEVTPSNIRWNSECDCVQQTPDGGTTWVDSPSQDPRSSTIFQVPPRGGDNPQCDSAQQMHDRVKNMLDAIIASSDILQAINSFVAVVAIFFFEVGIVIEAIWAIVSAIFSIGTTTLNAALTDAVYDQLLCIFYCHIGGDGTVTLAQFNDIQTDIADNIGGVAATAINAALDSIGFVGLTNAGALGEVTGDCSSCDCGWSQTWEGANSPAWDFFPGAEWAGGHRGQFSGGNFVTTDGGTSTLSSENMMRILLTNPGNFRRIEVTYTRTTGSFAASGGQVDAMIYDSSNGFYNGTSLSTEPSNVDEPISVSWIWTGDQDITTNFTLWLFAAEFTSGSDYGIMTVSKIKMSGSGDNPFV